MSGPRIGPTGAALIVGDLYAVNASLKLERVPLGALGGEVLTSDPGQADGANPIRLQQLNPNRVLVVPSDTDNQVNYDFGPTNHRVNFRTVVSQDTTSVFIDNLNAARPHVAWITFVQTGNFDVTGWPAALRWLNNNGVAPAIGRTAGDLLLVCIVYNGTELVGIAFTRSVVTQTVNAASATIQRGVNHVLVTYAAGTCTLTLPTEANAPIDTPITIQKANTSVFGIAITPDTGAAINGGVADATVSPLFFTAASSATTADPSALFIRTAALAWRFM